MPGWCELGSASHMSHVPGQCCTKGTQKVAYRWRVQCSADTYVSHGEPPSPGSSPRASLVHPSRILCGRPFHLQWAWHGQPPPVCWWYRPCLHYHSDQLLCGWGHQQPPHHLQPPQLSLSSFQLYQWWWHSSQGCPQLEDLPPTCHLEWSSNQSIVFGGLFQNCPEFLFFLLTTTGSFWNCFIQKWEKSVPKSYVF